MSEKRIVLFDLDGTLIDTAPDMHRALGVLITAGPAEKLKMSLDMLTHLHHQH